MTREQFISGVESTQRGLRRYLVALCCGNSALADDMAQETYLKAYVASGELKEPDKFAAWIYKIGYNTFLNYRRGTRQEVDYDQAVDMISEKGADEAFRYQTLYSALDLLTPRERSAILLFYMEGYAIREIAEINGSTESAVKQHLSRGRNHLKDLLKTD